MGTDEVAGGLQHLSIGNFSTIWAQFPYEWDVEDTGP